MDDIKVKTPFRYPGGKFYALKYLLPFVHALKHDEYREPFVGGGSVFFGKPKAKTNWINDIDAELINIYTLFQSPEYRSLLKRLVKETASPRRHTQIKSLTPTKAIDRAFRYYYLNRTSYSGKLISASWGYREKRSVPPHRWGELVLPAHKKLANTKITNIDFEKVISAPSRATVLLYIDPPYFLPPKKKHYNNGFSKEDHARLEKILRRTRHSFLLSYEDCPEVRELYRWATIYELAFPYRVGDSNTSGLKRKIGREIVISNRRIPGFDHLQVT